MTTTIRLITATAAALMLSIAGAGIAQASHGADDPPGHHHHHNHHHNHHHGNEHGPNHP